jgi:phosphohistidine phosphatase SixA
VTALRHVIVAIAVALALTAALHSASAQTPKPIVTCAAATAATTADTSKARQDSAALVRHYPSPDSTLIAALRKGGYVIVFRHGKTDWAQRDADLVNFADRNAQRNLRDEGRQESVEIGKAIAGLHIPVGKVLASPMWRCRDTATLAFGKADTTIDWLQKGAKSRDARIRMLSTPPAAGSNLVIVTHQDVLLPITKLRRDELGEGEALIVKPLGQGTFEVLAQASLADWIRFLPSRKL